MGFYLKCANPKYIQDLPYSLHSTNTDELEERLDAIEDEINRRNDILARAEYRIGVKRRDIDRLTKRINKHYEKMDKSTDNINKESDKIVKGIEKLEKKLDKLDVDKSLKDSIKSRMDSFKKAHNKFFEMDLTPNNITTYKGELGSLEASGTRLHNLLVDLYNGGLITKTDLNNGDISKNITRIDKNITSYEKASKDYLTDRQKIDDDWVDVDYIFKESATVEKENDILWDNYDKTLEKFLDNGGDKDIKPGFNQEGHGTNIPELIDEMEDLQKEISRTYR